MKHIFIFALVVFTTHLAQACKTPMIDAITDSHVVGIQTLLAAGASVDQPDCEGVAPIFYVVNEIVNPGGAEVLAMTKVFLAAGPNLDVLDKEGHAIYMHLANADLSNEATRKAVELFNVNTFHQSSK